MPSSRIVEDADFSPQLLLFVISACQLFSFWNCSQKYFAASQFFSLTAVLRPVEMRSVFAPRQ
jgi:hypothetical protein